MRKVLAVLSVLLMVASIGIGVPVIFAGSPPQQPQQQHSSSRPPAVRFTERANLRSATTLRTIQDVASAGPTAMRRRTVDAAMLIPPHDPSHILVRFRDGVSAAAMRAAHDITQGRQVLKNFTCVPRLQLIAVPPGDLEAALADYLQRPDVLYAEPDYEVHALATPNDTDLLLLWGLANSGQNINGAVGMPGADIKAKKAWDAWTGDPNFRIAIIDTGIDYNHPDLAANIWVNPGEIPGNLIDDDLNGFVDDVHGYDFANNDGDPLDDNGHGSHVGGTIGAVGNNGMGVVGVNWSCKLVALKFLGSTGSGLTSGAVSAIEYIIDQRIKVSNNSWGSTGFSQALFDAIQAAQAVDHLFIAASGNDNSNTDTFPQYPAKFNLPNIISVAATDNQDNRAIFSNFGLVSVDLGAPGVDIWSTFAGSQFKFLSGTSMATPHVVGVAALLRSRTPSMSWSETKSRIMGSVRPTASMSGITVTGGILNAFAALDDCNANGVSDLQEIAGGLLMDCTGNGIPDLCEPDCNGNGIADSCDIASGFSVDCTGNGIPDECDPDCDNDGLADLCTLAQGLDTDCNNNTVPDACEPDCNGNGVADECDIDSGFSMDCTSNGIPDECDPDCDNDGLADLCGISSGINQDCNSNDIPDTCDVASGASLDCNSNAIPDECELDCNGNRVPDDCDLAAGTSVDCTGNGIPDECELDCNNNGMADSCEIAAGTLPDLDGNGISDDCVLGFFLVPVDATGPHTITGNTIHLDAGGQRVQLEVRFFGWDPTQSGSPTMQAYQAALDPISFDNGVGTPLQLARTPCVIDAECPGGFFSPGACINGFCDDKSAFVVDDQNPLYVFRGLNALRLTFANPGFPTAAGAIVLDSTDSVRDSVVLRYGLTISLDIPVGAAGSYVVQFMTTPDSKFTFWLAPSGMVIPTPNFVPAVIVLPQDCNGNGIEDALDIANGTSQDCNANGIPDECLFAEVDCNANAIPDACDIAQGTSVDANGNGVPDECEPGTLFVDAAAIGAGTGTSWTDAFTSLDDALAIAAASNGSVQQIWVAAGIYRPSVRTLFGDDRNKAFSLISGVAIYGGFAGGETILSQRDIVANETILSGDLNGDDTPAGGGTGENSYHVVVSDGADTSAVLDGFTVTGGNANVTGVGNKNKGGGILVTQGGVTLSGCTLRANKATEGGGLYVTNSVIALSKCLLLDNQANAHAGLFVLGGTTSVTVDTTRFLGNVSLQSGGAAAILNSATAIFRNCLFSGNVVTMASHSAAALMNSGQTFTTLINCTIVNNTAGSAPAGMHLGSGNATLINSIVWGNRSGSGVAMENDQVLMPPLGSSVTRVIDHNGIEGWTGALGGVGNTGGDPAFADADGLDNTVGTPDDDLRLLVNSACIDIGDSSALPMGSNLDLDGNPRVVGANVDAGAFENQMPHDCSALNNCSLHGICIADNVCQCDAGFSGADCSLFFCDNVNNCSGQGICIGPDICQCDPGFTGADCTLFSCDSLNKCSGQGSCIAFDVCQCNPGFTGVDCSAFTCIDVNNCSGQGTCIGPNTCQCSPGFTGANCSQFTCGLVNNCSGHGACVGVDVCQCDPGFEGVACNVTVAIPVMSAWGMITLLLLTVGAATIVLRRNQRLARC